MLCFPGTFALSGLQDAEYNLCFDVSGVEDLALLLDVSVGVFDGDEVAAAAHLADRLAAALAEYPTSIEEDERLEGKETHTVDGVGAEARSMLRRLRLSKKRIIRNFEGLFRRYVDTGTSGNPGGKSLVEWCASALAAA